jgi:hypothetical protein
MSIVFLPSVKIRSLYICNSWIDFVIALHTALLYLWHYYMWQNSTPAVEFIPTPIQWVLVLLSGVKPPGCEVNHSPFRTEAKNGWSYTSAPPLPFAFLAWTRKNVTLPCRWEERRLQGSGAETWGKESLGRPRRRWQDNIKVDLQEVGCGDMDWIEVAQDSDRWRAPVKAVMNLRAT